jgi:signal peptidase II
MKSNNLFRGMNVLFFSAIILLADQATKLTIKNRVDLRDSISVMGDFFRLTYIENPGMAFGIQFGSPLFFTGFASIASVVIFVYLYRIRHEKFIPRFALAIILGGAVGNLIDRFAYGQVVDFLDFGFGETRWPIFNIADSSVTVGMILLLSVVLFEKDKETVAPVSEDIVPSNNHNDPPESNPIHRISE